MEDIPVCLSLGAGVQSSALALAASCGVFEPMPVCAIFADTQDEPKMVYDWLNWLEPNLAFPVHRVTAGRLADSALNVKTSRFGNDYQETVLPLHVLNNDGSRGMLTHRTCTRHFKIDPIEKFLRSHFQVARGCDEPVVRVWMGISLDEFQRMKPMRKSWIRTEWPLIRSRWSRRDCILWMEKNGFPRPPRSACVYCPYRSNKEWQRLKDEDPDAFDQACSFEKQIQSQKGGLKGTPYLHKSCIPLEDVVFDSKVIEPFFSDDECAGYCGV